VRSAAEIEARIQTWRVAKAQFYPDEEWVEWFDAFIHLLESCQERPSLPKKTELRSRLRPGHLKVDRKRNADYMAQRLQEELGWATGANDVGAFKQFVWETLLMELHDAECTMKDDEDILLEGTGDPPDFVHKGRSFRFWLRLKHGRYRDERTSNSPIEIVWILYGGLDTGVYVLSAQDNTLSGLLTFSGDDFEFRMWNHRVP